MGNAYSTVPYNAQINQINTELSCSFSQPPNIVNQPYVTGYTNLTLSATSPLTAGSGQQMYYSDVLGNFSVTPFAENDLYNYSSVTMDIFVTVDASNASPASMTIHQTVTNTVDDGDFIFSAQPLGFTMGAAGLNHDLQLGVVLANFTFHKADGTAGLNGRFTCKKASPEYMISTTRIDSSSGGALAPSTGMKVPYVPIGYKYALASIPTTCQPSGLTSRNYNLTLAGVVPLSISSGSNFTLDDVVSFITIPREIVRSLDSFYDGYLAIIGLALGSTSDGSNSATAYGLNLTNSIPSNTDLARDFAATDQTTPDPIYTYRYITRGGDVDLPMPVPLNGSLQLGPFIAGASGNTFSVNPASFQGAVQGYGYDDGRLLYAGEVFLVCQGTSMVNLLSIPIS